MATYQLTDGYTLTISDGGKRGKEYVAEGQIYDADGHKVGSPFRETGGKKTAAMSRVASTARNILPGLISGTNDDSSDW